MTAGLRPYSSYKDSGFEWLGDVPEHWEIRRNKLFMREINELSEDGSEELLTVSQYTGVTRRRDRQSDEGSLLTNAASLVGYKRVHSGDLVMNIMLAWNGSLGYSPFEGIVSPAYCVFRAKSGVYPQFLHYLFRTPLFTSIFKTVSTGVVESRLRLYPEVFFRLSSLLPPLPEQTAIVRFLDYADTRIRRSIHAKQKLIKLLEEEKQAIIHQAVTRGLDPDVPLKPSGVEWLGDVPEHWDIIALKRVLHKLIDCEHKTAPEIDNSDYRVVRTTAVRKGELQLAGTYCTTEKGFKEWTRRGLPEPGDVIFTREAPAGEACIVPEGYRLCLGQRTVLMKLNPDKYNPQFLVLTIYRGAPEHHIKLASQGSTVGHFNVEDIAALTILAPPLQEQFAIIDHIEKNTLPVVYEIHKIESEITLLREYRTRLISDVVTGKLDVREAAARLPVEADEVDEQEDGEDNDWTEEEGEVGEDYPDGMAMETDENAGEEVEV
ncbi:hypothetical protein AZH53_09890 [Methanomicrobiaceae archaeon CYW5]|uniref:restriction endonuclease subunit S n=1 Tax=Methanovulcanius yangii TaxID=1789227 RepID=UPI0029CA31CB|nr:restriction endonuclease subunit S [Methanovulcanius yangii]MBT8508715.1 hypothetical protein [Methanovulcanius yangii]